MTYISIVWTSIWITLVYKCCCCSVSQLCPTPCAPRTAACQASLQYLPSVFTRSLVQPMSIPSVMPSNHLILCRPLLLLPSIFPSIRVFSNESALCTTWPKYWSFSFSISPSNEYSGLMSFRTDWLDLFAVWTLKTPTLQFEGINSSVLSFFIFQLSHPYMTTGKTIALTIQTFVGKVMSLLFNMLSRFVIAFIPRSKCLLTSSLTFSKKLFNSSSLSATRVVSSAYLRLLIFHPIIK